MPPVPPVPSGPERLLAEVQRLLAEAGTRRTVPRRCHVGTPGGQRLTLPEVSDPDAVLARDLVARALDGLDDPAGASVWLTRFGPPEPDDGDRFWHAAAVAGFARHGLGPPSFWLVHRRGCVELSAG